MLAEFMKMVQTELSTLQASIVRAEEHFKAEQKVFDAKIAQLNTDLATNKADQITAVRTSSSFAFRVPVAWDSV